VIVTAGALATITVTPDPATLAVGAQQQFTAVGRDANGNVVPITPVWTAASAAGTINAGTGLFTAGNTPGTFAQGVRATSGTITATATVIVTAGALATITVTPDPATLAVGAQQQFTAVGRDANGNVVPITPVWTAAAAAGSINSGTGLFTAGNTTGTFAQGVRATSGTITATATVIVTAGPLATVTVTPNPVTLAAGAQQQFTAVGRDAGGNVVPITPVWSTTNPPGTINSGTGLFTAGNTAGTFTNSVRATSGSIFGTATVTVTGGALPPPPPASTFRVLANRAVACSAGSITGDVGTLQAGPTGSFTPVGCPVAGGTAQIGTASSIAAYNNFVAAYDAAATQPCGAVLTGSLAGQILAPGVYCFSAAASLTGTLTLNGPSTGVWLFRIGTSGVGGLTTTNFSVVMAGGASACNVTWRVQDAATTTDTNFRGAILAGGNVTSTRGTLNGNLWSQGDVTITGTVLDAC
ncbi:MAG TPA: ice-binding family protein, partial [Longimicrobium sp.]